MQKKLDNDGILESDYNETMNNFQLFHRPARTTCLILAWLIFASCDRAPIVSTHEKQYAQRNDLLESNQSVAYLVAAKR